MKTPEMLIPALRQYKHNSGEGFVIGYDQTYVDTLVKDLVDIITKQREDKEMLVKAMQYLVNESDGVYGLHLNGDPSPWSELLEGGEFEEWLGEFSEFGVVK
jgi:hypothetical protein